MLKSTKIALKLHEFFPVALEIYNIVSNEIGRPSSFAISSCSET